MKKKLLVAAALLGVSLVSSTASSSLPRYCDTACPTSDGKCNCPKWSDKPGALSSCAGWNTIFRGGCWYE